MRSCLLAFLLALLVPAAASAQDNGNHAPEIAHQSWSFSPPFGTFDDAQLQRGFEVYRNICANCHSMRLLSYRNLGEPGGPEFRRRRSRKLPRRRK
jgi:cytochrome c1